MTTPDHPNAGEVAPDMFALELVVAAAKKAAERAAFVRLSDLERARFVVLANVAKEVGATIPAKTEEELIWPGNPRHTCDICGRRSAALHCRPCSPMTEAEVMVELSYLPDDYFSHAKAKITTPSNWPRLDAAILGRERKD